METNKVNFGKILFGIFIFLAIFGFVQLLKDNGGARERSLDQNLTTSPAGNPWPEGWVKWDGIFEGESVRKYGPEFSGESFIIVLPTSKVESLPDGSSCVGDQTTATCLVGNDEGVKKGFEAWANI